MIRTLPDKVFLSTLIGKTEEEARQIAQEKGCRTRTLERDGEHFMGTMDYDTNRITFSIADGIVTDTHVG